MTKSEIYKIIQDFMSEGTLIVVGSGLSAAEGLPTMQELSCELEREIPASIDPSWEQVLQLLRAGKDLESALLGIQQTDDVLQKIIYTTARLVRSKEKQVFEKVICDEYHLPFGQLLEHLFKASRTFHCITSNYDRIIEFATESVGIGIHNGFFGTSYGSYDSKRSIAATRTLTKRGREIVPVQSPTLFIHKPHGSLDWYEVHGKHIRFEGDISLAPLIITPGIGKYRASLKPVFEEQRTTGNQAIEKAKRYLVFGYGFNDDHLQGYLCPDGRFDKPTIIFSKHLTDNAKRIIASTSKCSAIGVHAHIADAAKSEILISSHDSIIVDTPIWNLGVLLQEVLL